MEQIIKLKAKYTERPRVKQNKTQGSGRSGSGSKQGKRGQPLPWMKAGHGGRHPELPAYAQKKVDRANG